MHVEVSRRAQRFFRRVPLDVARHVRDQIELLAVDPVPSDSVSLSPEAYRGYTVRRVRVGDYRVKYALLKEEGLVMILDIDKRARIYKYRRRTPAKYLSILHQPPDA